MKSYLLDTSIIIDYLRGKEPVVSMLDTLEGEFCSSYVCLAELYEGIYRVENRAQIERSVVNFFRSLSDIYSVDSNVARYFGMIRAGLKTKGAVIEDLDILIAATCLSYDLILVTRNVKHFSRVKNLKIYKSSQSV